MNTKKSLFTQLDFNLLRIKISDLYLFETKPMILNHAIEQLSNGPEKRNARTSCSVRKWWVFRPLFSSYWRVSGLKSISNNLPASTLWKERKKFNFLKSLRTSSIHLRRGSSFDRNCGWSGIREVTQSETETRGSSCGWLPRRIRWFSDRARVDSERAWNWKCSDRTRWSETLDGWCSSGRRAARSDAANCAFGKPENDSSSQDDRRSRTERFRFAATRSAAAWSESRRSSSIASSLMNWQNRTSKLNSCLMVRCSLGHSKWTTLSGCTILR